MQEIKNIVSQINTHAASLKAELKAVNTANESLKSKLVTLTDNLNKKQIEVEELAAKVEWLEQQSNIDDAKSLAKEKDLEIDALVREIDDCINRLKQ